MTRDVKSFATFRVRITKSLARTASGMGRRLDTKDSGDSTAFKICWSVIDSNGLAGAYAPSPGEVSLRRR